ncbi:MAG: hypothetical protein J6W10_04280 [Kiritimatiellae bacterium]|nr:hypothetical protein [Kiritimatiellia bacterium]
MRYEALERVILKNLHRVETGLKEKSLMCAVEVEMDRYDLTTNEFEDVIRSLEDKGLVDRHTTLIGDTVWGITAMGRDALKGL